MGKIFVKVVNLTLEVSLFNFKSPVQTIGFRLVRPKNTEIFMFFVQFQYISDIAAEFHHILRFYAARIRNLHRIVFKIRHSEVSEEFSAVGVRICAHAGVSHRRQFAKLRYQTVILSEKFFRSIASQPFFKLREVLFLFHGNRHLMCAESSLDCVSVNNLRSCPALRRFKNNHRPHRTGRIIVLTGPLLLPFSGFL